MRRLALISDDRSQTITPDMVSRVFTKILDNRSVPVSADGRSGAIAIPMDAPGLQYAPPDDSGTFAPAPAAERQNENRIERRNSNAPGEDAGDDEEVSPPARLNQEQQYERMNEAERREMEQRVAAEQERSRTRAYEAWLERKRERERLERAQEEAERRAREAADEEARRLAEAEAERLRQELERQRAAEEARARQLEQERRRQVIKMLSRCPVGFAFRPIGRGRYQCEGGTHFADETDIAQEMDRRYGSAREGRDAS